MFEEVIKTQPDKKVGLNEDAVKAKEQATYNLGKIYVEKSLVEEIVKLTKQILPLFLDFPKSKLAKVIRTLFDYALEIEGKPQELGELCLYIIDWCEKEERTFLRMRIETNLADIYYQ